MQIFQKKDLKKAIAHTTPLKRSLKTHDLIFLGIGAVIGTGIFVLTGKGALTAGPALALSFLLAAICCGFTGLCYAEFSSMVPITGSAYTYAYVTFGEIVAFIIGWVLTLEYALSAATVSAGWSGYFTNLIGQMGLHLPVYLTAAAGTDPGTTTYFNLPAFLIVLVITWVLSLGINQTKRVNDTMVIIKLAVIILFMVLAVKFIKTANWSPFAPFGWYSHHQGQATGIWPAASIIFFSFIGFDAVSSSAEETVKPEKTIPKGVIFSLLISTVLYIAMTLVMTGVVKYPVFANFLNAPILAVIKKMAMPWLSILVSLGAILGMTTVILVLLYGQTRINYAMSRDGLLPKFFSAVSKKRQTPFKGTWFYGILIALVSGLLNLNILAELANIGTLSAFIIVCAGILWMRHTHPHLHRDFKVPGVPFVPVLAIIFCLVLIAGLNWITWAGFIIWLLIGLLVYFSFSKQHSKINLHKT